ncbi:MAG: DUF4352 domain-containing protein [Kutzneria sp.]|nr:DUF4352 domain-containing protein [Kutzneria sp.]
MTPPANVNEGPFKIGDSVKFDGGLVGKVTKIQDVTSNDGGFPPDSGNRYVGVQIDVTNSDTTSTVFTPLLQAELKDPTGKTYDATPLSGYRPEAPNGDIKPQQTVSGVVVFEIPGNYSFSAGTAAGFTFVFRGGLGADEKVEIQLG